MISVALVDDHTLWREALRDYINKEQDFKITIEAQNGQEFIQLLRYTCILPTIAIIDVEMPIMNGYVTTTYLQEHFPSIVILGISLFPYPNMIEDMQAAGACAVISKNSHPQLILKTIIRALYLTPAGVLSKNV